MAGIRKIYTSQNEYLEDVVSTSDLFDKEYYETAKEAGKGLEYLTIMAGTKDNISSSFNQTIYDELSGEDRFNYYITENVLDKSSEQYASNKQYFDNKIQQIKNQQTYDGLNGFEKTMATIGGYVGNAFVQLGGIVEGLVDASATLIGAMGSDDFKERTKEFIAKDTTGYNAAQQAMNDWINKYTFIDKNVVTKAINDVATGIARMTPMIIGGILAPATGGISAKIGTSIYYASMAGNTAEQTIQANPDIDYGSLLLYTGSTTGLEALTEWASGKLFGDDIVSSLMKGQKYAPTGSIVKNIAKNFGTEALEEATSELFGSMLYKTIVDPTAETATFGDIFYAAIIGGLTGAVMSGGQILTTKRMSVKDGKLIATSELSKADKKSAKQLGIAKSWGLNNLLSQVQQGQQSTNEVTKLMAKYGTSVNNIMISHQDEYNQAIAKDTETKTQQAKAILDLANLMRAIGVEQFQRSAEFLNNSLEEARTLVNNYFTHTATYNANASAEFSEAFPDESFTPVAQPTNAEIELAKVLRHTFPDLKIAFGQFGSKNGTAVKSINDTKGWLFIKSGLIETMGYDGVLNQIVKKELSKGVLSDLSKMKPELVDSLVGLIDTDKKHYSDLSEREKTVVAQIICFDPVNNRRLFERNNKLHSRIFSYLTKQSEYVKRFGRKTSANKMLYHDLLSICEMFLNNIAQTIFNDEDVAQIQTDYDLTSEEVAEKITNKTRETSLNKVVRLTNINFSKESVLKREAIYELIEARLDTTVDFDYTRIYDESYYNPEWVQQIKTQQQTQDFKAALNAHFEATVQNTLEDRASFVELMEGVLTQSDIDRLSKTLITEQRRAEIADMPLVMMYDVIDVLYTMTANDVDDEVDSIVIKDNQIKGTGKLDFIVGEIPNGDILLSRKQGSTVSKSARDFIRRVPSDTATYTTNTKITNLEFSMQDDSTIDDHQKALVNDFKNKTGLTLHFFKDAVVYKGKVREQVQGFVNGTDVYVRYDGTLTNDQLNKVMEHEASHKRRDAEPEKYEALKGKIEQAMTPEAFNELYAKYERLYEPIYGEDDPRIEEEMVINIAVGIEKPTYKPNEDGNVKAFIKGFMKTSTKLMKQKISEGVRFSEQDTTNITKSSKASSPKQIADAITSIVANSPIAYSESQGFDATDVEYTKVAQSMIDENFSLFRKVNQDNYKEIRQKIAESNQSYTDQALIIFDRALFTYAADSSRFDKATQEAIKNQARRTQTISAQWQGLQSRRLADKTSLTEVKNKFAEEGINVAVSDDMVAKYVPEIKNKSDAVKQIDNNIAKIEQQIENANDDIERAALNKELKDQTDKRIVIEKGTNEEILDWAITNEDIVSRAAKIQKDVFEQMVEKAELAAERGKKAVTILVNEKTGLPKPFPKTTQAIEKTVKKLKSFRMWAMLTSPVSWVRNWVGNAGMTALDSMTNSLEKWMTARLPKADVTKLEQQVKALQNKKDLSPKEQAKLAELHAQIQQAYDFKFVETTASKELKQQIAKDYKDVLTQILNGEDVSKYEGSAEKAGAIARAEREITRKSQNATFAKKLGAACQSMTDWGLNTGLFGDNAVVLNSLVKNFANMVESNKSYLLKSLSVEYGKDGRGMSDNRKALVEKALNSKEAIDIVNAMSKADTELFLDSCKQRTFEQYFKNSNWLSKWASNLSQKHPIMASLTSMVLPFPKVAANVMTMAYKYSPLGFISALRQWSVVKQMDAAGYEGVRDAFARAKLTRTTAQATVGTMMCIAGLILAALGVVDIDEDDYMGPSLNVGDIRISLSNLAPSMTTFSVGAGMLWAWKNDKSAMLQALDVLYDNTLLGNIENVFRYGSPDKYIENLSINYVSQYVPAVLKLFAKFTTNQATIDKSGSYFEKLGKTFASGVPFVANALPKKINPYTGEVLTGTGSQNVFFNFIEALSPLDFKATKKSATQKEAERLGTESSGLSGAFKVNDVEYDVDKVTYGKYRANYIEENFEKILSGKQKVTVEDENGKRITTTYDKLTDKQKKNVINRLYTEATSMTKIKWWTDLGNKYVVTDQNLYNEYRKMFKNIVYKNTWSKSKFMES